MNVTKTLVCERCGYENGAHALSCPTLTHGIPAERDMGWPIWAPERQPTLANARISLLNDENDMGRILAGAIVEGDRECIAFILGATKNPCLRPVAEAALNLVGES